MTPTRSKETARPSEPSRVTTIDLLRAVAAASVVLFHFGFSGPTVDNVRLIALPEFAAFARYGYLGVQLFFVISGFAIAYSSEGRTPASFAISRAVRIYPGFVFCMTLTFVIALTFGRPWFQVTASQWMANLVVAAPMLKQHYMDNVYWTIVLEIIFYFWVWLLMLAGLFPRHVYPTVVIWMLFSLANEFCIHSHILQKLFLTDQSGFFVSGLLLYQIYIGRRDAGLQILLACAAACATLQAVENVEWWRLETGTDFNDYVVATISIAIIAIVALALRIRDLRFGRGIAVAVGGATYPLYLLHLQIGYIIYLRLQGAYERRILVATIFLLMALAAWAISRFVERPSQQAFRWLLQNAGERSGVALGRRLGAGKRFQFTPRPSDG